MSELIPTSLLRLLSEIDEKLNSSDGEITKDLELIFKALSVKIDHCVEFHKHIAQRLDFLDQRAKEIIAAKKTVEEIKNRFNAYLLTCIGDSDHLSGEVYSIKKVKNPPSVVINDIAAIPSEFFVVTTTHAIDKDRLKEALKLSPIEGCELSRSERIKIEVKKV